jgi:hypothetical protein
MAWEKRPGGVYYYTSKRVDGRVVKRYFGRGPLAKIAFELDARARRERQSQAEILGAERAALGTAEDLMESLDEACRLMTEAAFTAAGYHRQNFSAWRKKRERRDTIRDDKGAVRGRGSP